MSITFAKKHTPTNAASLGITNPPYNGLSQYAFFHLTFMGYDFFCHETKTIKRKSQVFWRNPFAARDMAKSLIVPANYTLIEYSYQNQKPQENAA